MKRTIRVIAIVLLFFNAVSAMFGGLAMILDPTGELLQMPIEVIEPTPFTNFLIPGIILFTVNGLFNLFVGILGLTKSRLFPVLTTLCGILLTGWIVIQTIMIQAFDAFFHTLYLAVGILLIIGGWFLLKQNTPSIQEG